MAADDDAFREAVLAHPCDHGPRQVWADWLDECGDRRGAWLRYWCALEAAALAVPPGARPAAAWDRDAAVHNCPANRRLLTCVLADLTPLPDGQRVRDVLAGTRAAGVVAVAGLHACGLATAATARTAAGVAASAQGVLQVQARAGGLVVPQSLLLALGAARATAAGGEAFSHAASASESPSLARGWQVRCCEALAAVPAPPPWGHRADPTRP
jgi:uncharacterized protein (TIGR02996 family)